MKQDHRNILAVALSTAILVMWFILSPPKPVSEVVQQKTSSEEATPSPLSPRSSQAQTFESNTQHSIPLQEDRIETPFAEVLLTNDGGSIRSWKLKDYRTTHDQHVPVDMMSSLPEGEGNIELAFDSANFFFPKRPRYSVEREANTIRYRWRSQEVEVTKAITFHTENHLADVMIEVKNITSHPLSFRPVLKISGLFLPESQGGFWKFLKPPSLAHKQPAFYIDGKVDRFADIAKLPTTSTHAGTIYWAGLEDRYFLSAIIPGIQGAGMEVRTETLDLPALGFGARNLSVGMALPKEALAPDAKTHQSFLVYAGPKEISALKKAGSRLDTAIDYGWFSFVAVPILHLLKFFYRVVHNYGVAIILLTIFIKLLLHPVSRKSMQSMRAMQKLQPELKDVQKKYGKDKNRLQQETMLLFKRHKVNPLGGCLPMLLQFPIYIALYKVLWSSIELYRAPFFWFYQDLSAPDPYLITPILLGIFMVAQQKMTPSTSLDPAQQKMMMIMPVMFSAFMIFLPVGLTVYILVNTAMTVLQQWMANNDLQLRDFVRGRFRQSS